jgi:hypothetical protein
MQAIVLISAVLSCALWQAGTTPDSSSRVQRLQAKLAVEAVQVHPPKLAGRYTSASRELGKRIGGGFLSGEDLYLFRNGTYIYCEWADIQPVTIYDKGQWNFTGGLVSLKSDPDIKWHVRLERQFVPIRRPRFPKEVVLIGVDRGLKRFEEEADDDPEFWLLVLALVRDEALSAARAAKIKAELMDRAWRPEDFQ